jgi:predicted ArsR family transcriptional regulator
MQDTRQRILEYLKSHGQSTVEELRNWLGGITAVTVRHHLDVLRRDGLVDAPAVERRESPGRPRYVYMLTEKASEHFPKNYRNLTDVLLDEINIQLGPRQANVLFEAVAERLADEGPSPREGETFEERLQRAVAYLTEQGYVADYEEQDGGYILCTSNCPYDRTRDSEDYLCVMDVSLVSSLTGVVPRRLTQITKGDHGCSYFLPLP